MTTQFTYLSLLILLTGCNHFQEIDTNQLMINALYDLDIKGFYNYNTQTIVITDTVDLDDRVGMCIYEHEYAHHRQYYLVGEPELRIVSQDEIHEIVLNEGDPFFPDHFKCKNEMELEAFEAENVCRERHRLKPISQEIIESKSTCPKYTPL